MHDCTYDNSYEYREVKMKGKKTGKSRYMVIIDEDEENIP